MSKKNKNINIKIEENLLEVFDVTLKASNKKYIGARNTKTSVIIDAIIRFIKKHNK